MRRREFIALLAAAVAWPRVARTQQSDRMRRVGVLMGTAGTPGGSLAAFRQEFQNLGWLDDRNVRIAASTVSTPQKHVTPCCSAYVSRYHGSSSLRRRRNARSVSKPSSPITMIPAKTRSVRKVCCASRTM